MTTKTAYVNGKRRAKHVTSQGPQPVTLPRLSPGEAVCYVSIDSIDSFDSWSPQNQAESKESKMWNPKNVEPKEKHLELLTPFIAS